MAARPQRTYFAETLEAAIAQARKELGPEALLLEAGPSPAEEARRGGFRVVCAPAQDALPEPGSRPAAPAMERSGGGMPWEALQRRLDRLEHVLEQAALAAAVSSLPPALSALQQELACQDVPALLVPELLRGARARLRPESEADSAAARTALAEELCSRLRFQPELDAGRQPAVVVFVGPPGAGKTSMLVKVAMQEGVARRRSAAIVSTDGYRVAASEQLRTYAAILGLPYVHADTPAALRQAVAENAVRELVLIDTPGFSRCEQDWAEQWARMLEAVPGREVLLVLPAAWRTRDLLDLVRRSAIFHPSALAFTRLDETEVFGGWASAALEAGLPIRWFGTGQRIPEDIEAASANRIRQALGAVRAEAVAGSAAAGARG
jgi:flagellar biosynthesis protein FlhF